MKKTNIICVGAIAGAHGVRGLVRLRSFTDDPEAIFSYKPLTDESGERVFKIKQQGIAKDCFITMLDGVKDRDAAEALRGTKLFIGRTQLPKAKKGQFYETDLINLAAKDGQGKIYGSILAVHDYGAGVFLEIGKTRKDSFMLPFTNSCVPEIDRTDGFILIAPPEGWLDKEEKK